MVETSYIVMQYAFSITPLFACEQGLFWDFSHQKVVTSFESQNWGSNHSDVALIKSPIARPCKDILIVFCSRDVKC